jgi:hypothetical protein
VKDRPNETRQAAQVTAPATTPETSATTMANPIAPSGTTVLNRVRPTVVVRRRVYDPPPSAKSNAHVGGGPISPASPAIDEQSEARSFEDDDDSGPPSSVNVARALASLRGHEVRRLEELLSADDEDEVQRAAAAARRPEPSVPAAPAIPTVKVGPSIALVELAQRMSVPTQELITSLVTRGFFSVTVKTMLPRETARAAATLFGWQIEETDEVAAAPTKSKAEKLKTRAEKPKAMATPKTSPKGKSKLTQKKPRSGTRG